MEDQEQAERQAKLTRAAKTLINQRANELAMHEQKAWVAQMREEFLRGELDIHGIAEWRP